MRGRGPRYSATKPVRLVYAMASIGARRNHVQGLVEQCETIEHSANEKVVDPPDGRKGALGGGNG